MDTQYNSSDWFWRVGADGPVYSSAAFQYVQTWDADRLTVVDSEATLQAVLKAAGVDVSSVVGAERDRRIAAGFAFGGKSYDGRPEDKLRISGAVQMATLAIMAGAQAGNLLWHGGVQPFTWIAQDNSLTTMDAQTVVAFGQAAAAWETAHIFAGRAIKALPELPANWRDSAYWP